MKTQSPQRKPTVLVVDDDPLTFALLERPLTFSGFPALSAGDGHEAIEIARVRRPQIVILDWVMPGLHGPAVCRELRSLWTPPPYVIMLTVHSATQRIVEALDAGADDYLTKPFESAELCARLRAGVRTVGLQRSLAARALVGQRMARRMAILNGKLEALASTDELTGLLNRRSGIARLDQEWRLSVRYDHPLACAMIDIDNFKRINDTLGHVGGDAVLRNVGAVLRDTARDTDMVIRHGGEEFLVVMPHQNENGAALAAERYRAAVEAACGGTTISAGVAARSAESATPERILRHADAALYAAKRRGKNCVHLASEVLRQPHAA
jgi:two-component system cell cycle response regulator